jgi:trimethylamine---corrinoid protein Co-methyltransferase
MLTEQAENSVAKHNIELKQPGAFGLQSLSQEDCSKIHEATLEILDQVGVIVTSSKAQAVFADHGARIDKTRNLVCLPPQLVEKALATIPSVIRIPGRERARDYIMGGDKLDFINFGTTVFINDLYTGKRRDSVKQDLVEVTRLLDTLSSIKILITALSCTEKSPLTETMHTTAAMLANSTKPVEAAPPTANLIPKMALMGEAAVGKEAFRENPFFFTGTCMVSPLQLVDECSEVLMAAVEHGFVTSVLSMCLAGGTSPIHLAGTVVQHNAEVLSGLVLGQLVKPGAPMIYSSSTTALDMRFGTASVGSVEGAILNAALVKMGRYYNMPVRVSGG